MSSSHQHIMIAHLGPAGTYAETAAITYVNWLKQQSSEKTEFVLKAYPSIPQSISAIAKHDTQLAVVPVENSIEGSVSFTLDTLWELDDLKIQHALVLPISHALVSEAQQIEAIQTVYSHPQALAQCQKWLEQHLPSAKLIPANSTTEVLSRLAGAPTTAAISSQRAAELYQLPILAHPINDRVDNCTRFWIIGRDHFHHGSYTSIAFTLPANKPGALVTVLQMFAQHHINLSRIESRPTKRSLGEYLFFIDFEADMTEPRVKETLDILEQYTETLKIFGSYSVIPT
ncbi:MAG: prephenate dehydratase [Thainema sp.]